MMCGALRSWGDDSGHQGVVREDFIHPMDLTWIRPKAHRQGNGYSLVHPVVCKGKRNFLPRAKFCLGFQLVHTWAARSPSLYNFSSPQLECMERPSGLVSHARLMETAAKPISSQRLAMGAGGGCLQATHFLREAQVFQVK